MAVYVNRRASDWPMERWLGDDARHLVALAAFGGTDASSHVYRVAEPLAARAVSLGRALISAPVRPNDGTLRTLPTVLALGADASVGIVDSLMRSVELTEQELRRQLDIDLAGLEPSGPSADADWGLRLARLETELTGRDEAERRLLAMLAHRRARLGDSAERASALATLSLAGGRLRAAGATAPVVFAAGVTLGLAGRSHESEALFTAVAAEARRLGARATFAAALGQRGLERYRRGDLASAAEDLRAGVDAARGQPWETLVDDGRAHLIRVLHERGEAEDAERELERWGATGPLPDTVLGNRLLVERGRLRFVRGFAKAALDDLRHVEARLSGPGDLLQSEWCAPAALASHRVGRSCEAEAIARAALAAAESWGAPRQLGIAERTLGLIEGGAAGVGHIARAAEILGDSPARLEHARTLIDLGAALRRVGHPREARMRLRTGIDAAAACGAVTLVRRGEQELAASGLRRRGHGRSDAALSGPATLTPSERRITRMAAHGLSNPEIANTLFVTRKTVEMHLGNAYRKLQIGSRQELAGVIDCV